MRTNRGRRLYVFFAVTLAVFVGLMTLTGILCDGFATADRVRAVREAELKQVESDAVDRAKLKLAAAEDATAQALDEYETVHGEFTSFLTKHFADLAAPPSNDATTESRQNQSESTPQRPARQMIPNPAWEKANQQLADLRRRRTELLANLTESHPLVRQMELAVRDVENQLKSISSEIEDESGKSGVARETPSNTSVQRQLRIDPENNAVWHEADEMYRELMGKVAAAEDAYKQALNHEKTERREFDRLAASAATAPMVVTTAGGANPRLTIYLSGLVAIAAGVMVARWSRVSEATFQTAAEVRQSLGVTVLGVIPRDPHVEPRERPRRELKWVRRTVVGAELFLTAAVVMLVLTAVADRQFLFDLIADPLAACSSKFWC
jgi:hypothetical protein